LARSSIDICWQQRPKQHWIEGGDRNTKFFHHVANRRRKFNAVHKIKMDCESYVDAFSIKGAIFHCYENLYSEE